ncbi:hypothetical protein [Aliiroseovarius crassostreae]|uniref:hypothetical protein n=1 Tax=Aliiroseovarius crassostreae TaxID=154981 RepID=UPI00220B66DB|nr:hypothetical protein [Aliiroseovarius crassostreae]UWP88376.1 hypothetical protein K3J57_10745 [Aliiroseovarius crassostreae]
MSKYDELRSAFAEYKEAERQYVQENQTLALLIVNGLRDYLEMPASFPRKDGDVTYTQSYTPFFSVDEDGNTEEKDFYMDALSHFSDGSFKFAFGVILERAEGAFPKHNLILHVECKRKGSRVHIDVSGESTDCDFDGRECPQIEKVHAMIFAQIQEWLKHRPGDGHGFSKFGFSMH